MTVLDLDKINNAIRQANTAIDHLRILLKMLSREKGLDDKFERLNLTIIYNFDLLTEQIAAAKAALLQQIKIQRANPQPEGTQQLTALRDQIQSMEKRAQQFKQYQEIYLRRRKDHLISHSARAPVEPTTGQLIKELPKAPAIEPLMALLESAKVSTMDPEIGAKLKYIKDSASDALSVVTRGMNAEQLRQFKEVMAADLRQRAQPKETNLSAAHPLIALMKINIPKLDPELGAKIKYVQDAIKNAYVEVTKKSSAEEIIRLNTELKNEQQSDAVNESKRRPS